ncbi:MAG: hypothetical protein ACE5H3_06255 [Planctomycetota bacterium]
MKASVCTTRRRASSGMACLRSSRFGSTVSSTAIHERKAGGPGLPSV